MNPEPKFGIVQKMMVSDGTIGFPFLKPALVSGTLSG
jgi:hypothetical protein